MYWFLIPDALTMAFLFVVSVRWLPEVQTIFYQGNKRRLVPSNQNQSRLESFFNCAGTLMTENMQQLTLMSIVDYTDLLCQPPVSVVSGSLICYNYSYWTSNFLPTVRQSLYGFMSILLIDRPVNGVQPMYAFTMLEKSCMSLRIVLEGKCVTACHMKSHISLMKQ